jgi:hypothetical protein
MIQHIEINTFSKAQSRSDNFVSCSISSWNRVYAR